MRRQSNFQYTNCDSDEVVRLLACWLDCSALARVGQLLGFGALRFLLVFSVFSVAVGVFFARVCSVGQCNHCAGDSRQTM